MATRLSLVLLFLLSLFNQVVRINHFAHGAVALARLGASEERVQRYYDAINPYVPEYNPDETLTELNEMDYLQVRYSSTVY